MESKNKKTIYFRTSLLSFEDRNDMGCDKFMQILQEADALYKQFLQSQGKLDYYIFTAMEMDSSIDCFELESKTGLALAKALGEIKQQEGLND